MTSSGRLMKH